MRSPCPSQHGYILLSDQGCIATLAADCFLVGSYLLDKPQVNRICFDQDVWGRLKCFFVIFEKSQFLTQHENSHLQCQRNQWSPAGTTALAGRKPTRCCMSSGAQSPTGEIP